MANNYYLRCFFEEINGTQYYFEIFNNKSEFIDGFKHIILDFLKNKKSFSKNKKYSKFLRIEFIKDYQTIMMIKSFDELIDKKRIHIEYIESINWNKLTKEELSFYIINNFGKIGLLADSEIKQKMINVSKFVNLTNENMKPYKYFEVIVSNLENKIDNVVVKKTKYFTPIKFRE
jgi:hypothetical protein